MSHYRNGRREVRIPSTDFVKICGAITDTYERMYPGQKRSRSVDTSPAEQFEYSATHNMYKMPTKADGLLPGRDECLVCGAIGKLYHDEREGHRACLECGAVKDRSFVADEVRRLGEDKDGEKGEDKTRTSWLYTSDNSLARSREIAAALRE